MTEIHKLNLAASKYLDRILVNLYLLRTFAYLVYYALP
jgi:hypothetical protein